MSENTGSDSTGKSSYITTVRDDEKLLVGDNVEVQFFDFRRNSVRIRVIVPREVKIEKQKEV